MIHSNRICIISLSPEHPVLKDSHDAGKEITSIHFQDQEGHKSRLDNKVSGRKKHGGQKLKERSVICRIECRDGTNWHILTGVKGKLVEINENLISKPDLLRTDPWASGYIAIVMANPVRMDLIREQLLTADAYHQVLEKRGQDSDRDDSIKNAETEITNNNDVNKNEEEPAIKKSKPDPDDDTDQPVVE
jgi:glycine cleavage system H lipoate-binding protein